MGSRFPGSLNLDMNEVNTNMVPYPDLKFISTGASPIYSNSRIATSNEVSQQLKDEIFWSSCCKSNQLLNINPLGVKSVLLGTTLVGRGNYSMSDMRGYVEKLQSKATFTPWSTKAMKVGLCKVPPNGLNASMLSMFNTSAMANLIETVLSQFTKLYTKRAHAHHYLKVSGFELEHFTECQNSLRDIITSYREFETMKPIKLSRLTPLGV